ncbi:MAG: VanW family protein [Chloroflexota bacterium]
MYTLTPTSPIAPSSSQTRSFRRSPLDFVLLFLLLVAIALLTALASWQFWHANRIYTGVSVANVSLSGLTRATALNELSHTLQPYPLPPVRLTYNDQQWPLTADSLDIQIDLVTAVNRAYLVGREGRVGERYGDQFGTVMQGAAVAPPLVFNIAQMRQTVSQIAAEVRRPARAPETVGDVTIPAQPGIDVDVDQTIEQLIMVLQTTGNQGPLSIPLVIMTSAPSEVQTSSTTQTAGESTDDDASETGDDLATTALSTALPLLLHSNTQEGIAPVEMAIDAEILDALILSREPLRLDEGRLRSLLLDWQRQLAVPARDARLRFNSATGGLTVIQPSQVGRRLEIEPTFRAIQRALQNGEMQAPLMMVGVPPKVDMNNLDALGIRELVASGTTYFAGSSVARIRNIEVAAEKFEGVVIAPGDIMSFNQFVEDVSSANGFEDSLIIWGDRTAVGVGGGVCQVSTTLFRAAYEGGFPIVERYNHGYVVDWYGEPGMDATIYTPYVDFKFRNDTGAHILVEPDVDSVNGVITFNFYGTNPNRTVTVGTPQTQEVLEPLAPIYSVDESLTPGQVKQVEWPKKGLTVSIERTIVEDGQTRTDSLVSQYQPWRAMYLVGSEADLPQETGE